MNKKSEGFSISVACANSNGINARITFRSGEIIIGSEVIEVRGEVTYNAIDIAWHKVIKSSDLRINENLPPEIVTAIKTMQQQYSDENFTEALTFKFVGTKNIHQWRIAKQ